MSARKPRRRSSGRPKNRGKRHGRVARPARANEGPGDGGEAVQPVGRAVEKLGSAHARAVALTILGPAPPEPPPRFGSNSPLDFLVSTEAPDLESDPVAVREVIPRAQFPRINRVGGAFAYLLKRYRDEAGKFRLVWIGPATNTLVEETFVVPEPREDRERREETLREMEERRLDDERMKVERAAKQAAVLDEWVRGWVHRFAGECGNAGRALGKDGQGLVQAVEGYLRANALHFVEVRWCEFRIVPVRFRGATSAHPERRWFARPPFVAQRRGPDEVWAALRMFLPPVTRGDERGRP